MAQDFAKQRMPTGVRRQPTARAATRTVTAASTSHWSWYFSGLMSGVIVAIVAYLGLVKLEDDATETTQIVQAAEDPVEQPTFNFGFYKDLENAEVAVSTPIIEAPASVAVTPDPATDAEETPPSAAAAATTAETPVAATPSSVATVTPATPSTATSSPSATPVTGDEKQNNYLLQVGSFQNRQDAESHRARLIMLNLDASIVAAVVSGRTVQRVLVGPFNSRASAEESREMLSENGIDSIPLLMR